MWSDNNIVRTLSNFHPPKILQDGLLWNRRVGGVWERHQTSVSCPEQNRDYSKTFHIIDKGNGAEAKYNIGLQSHKNGCTPKLRLRYFNININNAYKVYEYLVNKHTPGRCYYDLKEAIDEAAHALLQRVDSMRLQKVEHPVHVRNLETMWDKGSGKRMQTDAQGAVTGHGRARFESICCLTKTSK